MTGEAQADVQAGLAGTHAETPLYPLKPLVRKVYLELPPPTLQDNITDVERVNRELRKKIGWHSFEISLTCLQHLSDTLREHDWKITVTVVKNRGRYRIQKIEPLDTSSRNFGLAVDVGTTTVVAQLVDLKTGRVLGVEGPRTSRPSGERT